MARSWLDALSAACLSFLILLGIGAVLLLAAKFQYPGFGAGANPIQILSAITIVGLGVLRAPIHLGTLVVVALPLGALIMLGAGITWACNATSLTAGGVTRGLQMGPPFAVVCWIASLAFRFRGEDPVFAGSLGTALWALVWGSAFGALAAYLRRRRPDRWLIERIQRASDGGPVAAGVAMGARMLASAALVGTAVLLLLVTGALIRGGPAGEFSLGDAIAGIVYLVSFLPNLVAAVISVGMGAPIDIGARVTVAGSLVARSHEVSWFGSSRWIALSLVVVPLAATMIGGYWSSRRGRMDRFPLKLGVAAITYAIVLAALAMLGDARLGAGILGRGVARADINAPWTFLAGLVWAGLGGAAGWFLRSARDRT